MLAADGYHQLSTRPTIGAGATDAFSGTTDIDGARWILGRARTPRAAETSAGPLRRPVTPPPAPPAGAAEECKKGRKLVRRKGKRKCVKKRKRK